MIKTRRVWSLLDITNLCNVYALCGSLILLDGHAALFSAMRGDGNGDFTPDEQSVSAILAFLAELVAKCEQPGFKDTAQVASLAKMRIEIGPADASTLASEMDHVRAALLTDFISRKFVRIEEERSKFIDQEELLGPKVNTAFPSASPDLKEAGNCMAAECNTAAVFHLMRAVEWALRALAIHLGVTKFRSVKKSGKVKYTPVAYSDWEHILDTLQTTVDFKIQRLKRGPEKQKAQEFYYPALQDVRALRDAWRNHVMHTRAIYDRNDANAVFGHVKRLMVTLAERVAEC